MLQQWLKMLYYWILVARHHLLTVWQDDSAVEIELAEHVFAWARTDWPLIHTFSWLICYCDRRRVGPIERRRQNKGQVQSQGRFLHLE